MARPTVFLSYTRHDEALIQRIASDLRECQIDAWYDRWEIKPGDKLLKRILGEAIPTADAFFVYLTPESIKSKWVQDELETAIEEARDQDFPILTFVNSVNTIRLLPSYLKTRNLSVVNSEQYEPGLRQIIRAVTEASGERKFNRLRQEVDYVLQPTLRTTRTLLDSIKDVGLTDIENRDDTTNVLPPSEFYKFANREVFISGLTLERTFDQRASALHEILQEGKLLRLLLLRPDAEIIPWLSDRENRDLGNVIMKSVIEVAQREKIVGHPNFTMRLMDRFPTFTAVILDGDIERRSAVYPSEIQFRIQPTTIYKTHHNGLVVQLRKSPETPHDLFDFVVDELRAQWANAIDLNQFLANKPA